MQAIVFFPCGWKLVLIHQILIGLNEYKKDYYLLFYRLILSMLLRNIFYNFLEQKFQLTGAFSLVKDIAEKQPDIYKSISEIRRLVFGNY